VNAPIYLDYQATTPLAPEARAAMLPWLDAGFGNPHSPHRLGREAAAAVEHARDQVAALLDPAAGRLLFTSGATEAVNWAIKGSLANAPAERRRIVTIATEHACVLDSVAWLERLGAEAVILPVGRDGLVDMAAAEAAITGTTALVAAMLVNNEIGVIQPIAEIGAICRERGVLFHTDAVQTAGKIPIDVRAMNLDLVSISAHKLYGPKGIGALYVRRGVRIERYQDGGEQERGRRGGTINVPGVVGLGKAISIAQAEMESEGARLQSLRDYLMDSLQSRIDGARIIGSRQHRLPMNAHLCIEGVQGEPVLLALDGAGICASAGSACTAGSTDPSHVLKALGIDRDLARGALRLTLGKSTSADALSYTVDVLADAVRDLRKMGAATH